VCWVQPPRSWFRGSGTTDTLEAKRKPIAAPAVVVQSPAASNSTVETRAFRAKEAPPVTEAEDVS
jgi:hypothetical protein